MTDKSTGSKADGEQRYLRFGNFTLDPRKKELLEGGRPIDLQPQPYRVLRYLAERSGTVVSREELKQYIWGGVHVDADNGLNFCIRCIREALGDDAGTQVYLRTVRGAGYMFVPPVESFEPREADSGRRRQGARMTVAAAAAGLVAALGLWVALRSEAPRPEGLRVGLMNVVAEGDIPSLQSDALSDMVLGHVVRSAPEGVVLDAGSDVAGTDQHYLLELAAWPHETTRDTVVGFRVAARRQSDSMYIAGPLALVRISDRTQLARRIGDAVLDFLAGLPELRGPEPLHPDLEVSGLLVADVGNSATAADVQVRCTPPRLARRVDQVRFMVVPDELSHDFDPGRAMEVPASSFHEVAGGHSFCAPRALPETLLDVTGARIRETTPYRVVALTLADDRWALSGSSPILQLAPVSYVTTLIDSIPASGGAFLDSVGNIYVGDWGPNASQRDGSTLYRIDPDGDSTSIVTQELRGFSAGLVAPDGDIYVTQTGMIARIARDGSVEPFSLGHVGPTGIVMTADGRFLVGECGASSIYEVTGDGGTSVYLTSELLRCPDGLALDDEGNLYVCNFNSGTLVRISPERVATVLADIPGGVCAHVSYFENAVYVTGHRANQVFRVSLQGEVSRVAGSGERRQLDGTSDVAALSRPNGLAIEPSTGLIYVTDSHPYEGNRARPNALRVIHPGPESGSP